ncbi:efflux RND transporter permease subunit [Psychrobium sp. MM17-31]|uniref:efflux RND transporter permease subunit n=1 Tax=Psychrobium sp. MM17-31 TaxID=2917758 RepID=UPI001EF62323|nr:efflux RND transporter permease subunit [Psychrobium sp. MM17-31]MCG7530675.1 efflux RND transporter permease subunit [Psychrobium sp. MM17-31]
MNIAEFSIKNQILSVIIILLSLAGGWQAYQNMARFEDPEFTIRTAVIFTQYPGGSPEQVAREVTEPLETALQQLQEVKEVRSKSSAGVSEINVDVKYEFSKNKEDLQVIWTKIRNKIKDAQRSLPSQASTPIVNDDFGDVYGLYYFITGPDYSPAELRTYAKSLQKELLQIKGVAKVALAGEQQEAIFVEISRDTAAVLGVSISKLYEILGAQNEVVAAGNVAIGDQRLIIDPSGGIDSIESIKNLLVSTSADGKITYLKDIAKVYRGYKTPTSQYIRYNQQEAIALGVSNVAGGNVVVMGEAVNAKLAESISRRPIGMEVHEYYHQGSIVEASVDNFVWNVIAALAIVIVTIFLFMGIRSAVVIGFILLLTIGATLATMNMINIPMHRISLGALIIALGMMVDNAIVVTEGILVGLKNGAKKLQIAKDIVSQTKWPLLGGTLVGIIAFAPIGFAPGETAEYTGDLFWVVMISLMFSWIFAITLTPLACYWLLPQNSDDEAANKPSTLAVKYKGFMRTILHFRWPVIFISIALFGASVWGAKYMTQGFFPQSTTPQMVIDYWLPEGTKIEKTAEDMKVIEQYVSKMDGVNAVQTLIGSGGLRFMLTYGSEPANGAYGQLLVRVDDYNEINGMLPQVQDYIAKNFPTAQAKAWRFVLGPGGGSKIEAVFKGNDPKILRQLANQAKDIMASDSESLSVKDDWRQPVAVIEPIYSESKGRRAGISRQDLANALADYYSGKTVGVYRENEDLIPIISRVPDSQNATIDDIYNIQVLSSATGRSVPIAQVTNGFRTIWRDGIIRREDRVFTITAQCDPIAGVPASVLQARIQSQIEAIELPDGYTLTWDGEAGNSSESSNDLMSTIPLGLLAMVLVVVILFGKLRQPIVIWLVVPLSFIGVVFGLVVTGIPLEFMGILGVLSLSGLLIKNAIVLVDQMDIEIADGKARFDAVIDSATSRVRPVMMGTLTTVLGVIPLFFDAFFQSMAVVLVFGLTFATLLTLLLIPVLYSVFMRISDKETA